MRHPSLAVALSVLALTGCYKTNQIPGMIDRWSFLRVGGTLFSSPESLTLKEIHLDTGTLTGRAVIIEGEVAETSQNGTFLVLKDDLARMLVVLTDMESARPLLDATKPKTLRILGTVETGKKGLPYVKAQSVNIPEEDAAAAPPVGKS
jgi:hypothetical protein